MQTRHFRVHQAWLAHSFAGGRASLLAGAYDLKSEFSVVGAARSLINPGFGVSPDLSSAAPGGAPVFPESSLGVRLRLRPGGGAYVMLAALNAKAGTVGDPGGADLAFRRGALLVGEADLAGPARLAVGVWRYARVQAGAPIAGPATAPSHGAYLLAEAPLGPPGVRQAAVFARIALAGGDAAPFVASWQTGLRVQQMFGSRPESSFSIGVTQVLLSRSFRQERLQGRSLSGFAETALEVTYADRLAPHLMLQPDIQWVRSPVRTPAARDAVVLLLRATVSLNPL